MKCFITGATGFIGSHLTQALISAGHEVTALLRPESDAWRLNAVLDRVRTVNGSFDQPDNLIRAVRMYSFDAVLHLAWKGVEGRNRFDEDQADVNLRVLDVVLTMAERMNVDVFMSMGSQAEYGCVEGLVDESHPLHPETRYAEAKCRAHDRIRSFCDEHSMRALWFRLFPVYGPLEREPWMIPSLINRISRGEHFPMTHAQQIRDYLFIKDAATAVRMSIESERSHGVYNLASGRGVRLKDLVLKIKALINPHAHIGFGELPFREDQSMEMIGDISRLQRDVGWSPTTPLDQGLRETIEELHCSL